METLCAVVGVTPSADELALHTLGLLVPGLLRCERDPGGGRAAHFQCQLGSVDAMAAFTSGLVELGVSHRTSGNYVGGYQWPVREKHQSRN